MNPLSLEPGTRYTAWEPAPTDYVPGKGEVRSRFAPGSWDRQVGKVVPLKVEGTEVAQVRLVAAEVAEDGSGVSLTYEVLAGQLGGSDAG